MQGRSLPFNQIFTLGVFVLIVGISAVGLWFTAKHIEPAPPKEITIATGSRSGAYFSFGQEYAAVLNKSGVTLLVEETHGSVENLQRLGNEAFKADAALVQGGLFDVDRAASAEILSLGRMFLEPVWVFYRGERNITSLTGLRGRRVSVGPPGSGTQILARELLAKNGIDEATTTFQQMKFEDSAAALKRGEVDAIFLTLAPGKPLVMDLLYDPSLKLMSLENAEAYTRIFPYLTRITLPRGVIDLEANIPPADVEMVANEAALVVRKSLHPALIGLLAEAARKTHSGAGLFHRLATYPKIVDVEYTLSPVAEQYYKSGPPFLQRYLPFSWANFIERGAIMLLPLAGIILPIVRGVPLLYQWRNRRRFLKGFIRLKELERQLEADHGQEMAAAVFSEVEAMEFALTTSPIPPGGLDQYYALKAAIDLVRKRVNARL